MIDYQKLKNWRFDDVVKSYGERDVILYALGIGLGVEPENEQALAYVYGPDLKVLPTYGAVLGSPGFFAMDPSFGLDAKRVLHGEQHVVLHSPIPPCATVVAENRITRVIDKGERGAVLHVERVLRERESGQLLSTSEQILICRADGGFSSASEPGDASPEPLPGTPERDADFVVDLPTRPEAALIYRLSGDMNPLHADPRAAQVAGFPRPILHGLATFGVAVHAVLRVCCDYDATALRAMRARFSSPAFPGDTIRTEIWRDGARLNVRASVPERGVTVLSKGLFEMTGHGAEALDLRLSRRTLSEDKRQ
jgi:acyl dehydratase